MRLLRGDHGVEFRKGWAKALKGLKEGERIASFPEIALERSRAPRPHTPGKPWECYRDDTSPLWEKHWVSSTCLLIGHREGEPWVVLAHNLPHPRDPNEGRSDEEKLYASLEEVFSFSEAEWTRLLRETPEAQQFSLASMEQLTTPPGSSTRGDGFFCAGEMRQNPFFQALFGGAIEPALAEHQRLACEYITLHISHNGRLDELTVPQIDLLQDPPIVCTDLYKALSPRNGHPNQGAHGYYLSAESLFNTSIRGFPGMNSSRTYEVSIFTPKSDLVNLVIVND